MVSEYQRELLGLSLGLSVCLGLGLGLGSVRWFGFFAPTNPQAHKPSRFSLFMMGKARCCRERQ
jgi:hypothetical protein